MKKKFLVKGMTCSACVSAVEKAVCKFEGITNVNVSLLNNSLELETDNITDDIIMKAVKKAGYKISVYDTSYNAESHIKKNKLIISIIFLIILLYIAMGSMIGLPLPSFLKGTENALYFVSAQVIVLIPIIILNFNYFKSGFYKLFKGHPNMDTLVAVGSTASIIYGIFATVMIIIGLKNNDLELVHKYHMDLYFESAGTIVTVVSIGKYIEAKSKGKTSDAIKMLLDLSGKTACVIQEEKEVIIDVDEIKENDIIKVMAGGSIPVDGIILDGSGSFNESSITGESIPVHKQVNDKVISGSILLDSVIYFKATTTSKNSTIAKIVKLVEEAASSKAPIARLADKISSKFVPIVMVLSLLTFIIWIVISKNLELSLSIGISVLVVSCPCALGLATPIAIMISTGVAAKNNILVKDAKSLENLSNINAVVFDKTGTITKNNLKILEIVEYDKEFIKLLGSLEQHSNHPLSVPIKNYIQENNISLYEVNNHQTIPGKGIEAEINGIKYYAGNQKYIEEKLDQKILDINTKHSIIILASDKVLGYVSIIDEIKENSKETIRVFKEKNIKTIMLTGDNKTSASYVKDIVGVDEVIAEVLPDEKGNVIKELKKTYNVLMVGDGINDAVALQTSNISMAIGNGSDIAIESANIILTNNDLYQSYVAYELSCKTIKNIKLSLFWAFFYNVICIPIACGVFYPIIGLKFNPMLASIAMSLSSVCVVLNALRLFKFKTKN